jgi:hypothetical protein
MSTAQSSSPDQALATLLAASTPGTIAGVIALMQQIDALLPPTDGLKWFNQMYLMVTNQVDINPNWQNPTWIMHLDVVFAGLYFTAIRDYLAGRTVADAWQVLFDARFTAGIDRIQFACAGMNAHINHDLALALEATNNDLNVVPTPGGPEHHDYPAVNGILKATTPAVLSVLATDPLGDLAEDTGKTGRVLALWDMVQARDLAWDFANTLPTLDEFERTLALDAQNAASGDLGRAILTLV